MIGGYTDNVPQDVEFHQVDCCDLENLTKAMDGCDIVYHTAATAYEGLSVFSPVLVTRNIFEASVTTITAAIRNKVKRIVYCSSMARYGHHDQVPYKETYECRPQDPYGIAKKAGEDVLRNLCDTHGVEYVIAVPHNIVGPRQKYDDPFRNVVSIMLNRMLQNKAPIIYGDGEQKRSFSNVRDCIRAVEAMIDSDRDICGQVYNIGPHDNEISIKELAYKVGHHCSVYPNIEHFPDRPAEVKNAFCSSDKIIRDFNYNTEITTDKTIQEMVAWIKREAGDKGKPFEYHLDLEFVRDYTPKTWTEKLI